MSPFHFCLSAAKNLSSSQLLPASLITDLLQLFLGLPLFLFPWGFQSRSTFITFLILLLKFLEIPFLFDSSKFHRRFCCIHLLAQQEHTVTHDACFAVNQCSTRKYGPFSISSPMFGLEDNRQGVNHCSHRPSSPSSTCISSADRSVFVHKSENTCIVRCG